MLITKDMIAGIIHANPILYNGKKLIISLYLGITDIIDIIRVNNNDTFIGILFLNLSFINDEKTITISIGYIINNIGTAILIILVTPACAMIIEIIVIIITNVLYDIFLLVNSLKYSAPDAIKPIEVVKQANDTITANINNPIGPNKYSAILVNNSVLDMLPVIIFEEIAPTYANPKYTIDKPIIAIILDFIVVETNSFSDNEYFFPSLYIIPANTNAASASKVWYPSKNE